MVTSHKKQRHFYVFLIGFTFIYAFATTYKIQTVACVLYAHALLRAITLN